MKKRIILAVTAAYAALFLLFPAAGAKGAVSGIDMCGRFIIPSLFPFMVLSTVLCTLFRFRENGFLAKMMERLFRMPGAAFTAVLLGFTGGYPVGANACRQLYETGKCDKRQAELLLTYTTCASPAFVAGMAGAVLLNDAEIGWLLYAVQTAGAVATALVCGRILRKKRFTGTPEKGGETAACGLSELFVGAVRSSCTSILYICGFIILFMATLEVIAQCGAVGAVSGFMSSLGFNITQDAAAVALQGVFEVSSGVAMAAALRSPLKLALISAIIGWGGICVHLQILSIVSGCGLSMKPYFRGKAAQAAVNFALTFLVCKAGSVAVPAFTPSAKPDSAAGLVCAVVLFLIFSAFLLISRNNLWLKDE